MAVREQQQRIQTVCLLILTALGLGVALFFLRTVLVPFVLALFLVHCLKPIIDVQMSVLGVRRGIAVVGAGALGCVVLVLLWLVLWSSVAQISENAKLYEERFVGLVDRTAEWLPLERLGIEPEEIHDFIVIPSASARGLLTGLVSSIMSVLSRGLLVVIFMIFMISGGGRAPPDGSLRAEVEARVRRYIITKVVVSGLTGILVGTTLAVLRVDFALAFGVLAFLMNFIPSIGSVIATLLPMPVILLDDQLMPLAKILAFAIPGVIQFSVGNIIEPKIMGGSLDLHPVAILLGLMFFGMIWGIVGMFLATPIVAVIKIVLERFDVTSPVAGALAGRLGDPPEPPGATAKAAPS